MEMPGPPRALVLASDDEGMRVALARLAALAGVTAHTVSAAALRTRWAAAAAVVVDAEAAEQHLADALPRRAGVLVVTPGEPSAGSWPIALRLGAEAVLALPRDERQVLDWLATVTEPSACAQVVCFLPARGGCGSSTLAAGFALAAGDRGREVVLVDADFRAGGNELLLGIEHVAGSRWDDFLDASGVLASTVLADALPCLGRVRILSCVRGSRRPVPVPALDAVVGAARRRHDLVVIDAANSDLDVSSVVSAADVAIVTVPADVRAVAAATGLVAQLRERCRDIRLVVRHPGPAGLRPRDVSEAVDAPVAAVWPHDRKLAALVDRGAFARGWRQTNVPGVTARLLDELGVQP